MAKKEYKTLPWDTKEVDLEGSTFEGYSAGIGNRDSMDDIIQPGAFDKTIKERVAAGKVKFLDGHDPNSTRNLWGNIADAEEVEAPEGDPPNDPSHLIWTLFQVSRSDPDAQTALGKIKENILDALSIGFFPLDIEYRIREELLDEEEDPEDIDPQMAWLFGLADRLINEVAWWETSAVVWGANPAALIIPGTVKDVVSGAARATMGGRGVTDEEAFETLSRMKSLVVRAKESPDAMRAFDYDVDGLSKALDPFIDCVNGTCSLSEAGKAASFLFDGLREAVEDAEPTNTTTVSVSVEKAGEVSDEVKTEDSECGCKDDADAPDNTKSEEGAEDVTGDAPVDVADLDLRETVKDLVWNALTELAPSAEARPDGDEAAELEPDDPAELDERQDDTCDEEKEDAGTERTSADDPDKHLPSEEDEARAKSALAMLDLELEDI